jgi:translation elongation factor EF-Tu-like GTPase
MLYFELKLAILLVMANKQVARISVTNVFNITSRGKVVGGDIIEGEIKAGDYFELIKEQEQLRYTINSVEIIHTRDIAKIGLLIKSESADLINLNDLPGQIIIIYE